jgi:hypothetical protein
MDKYVQLFKKCYKVSVSDIVFADSPVFSTEDEGLAFLSACPEFSVLTTVYLPTGEFTPFTQEP